MKDAPRHATPGTPRAVIIGAGPGGLATSMLLARSGFDVTLLERRDRVGGRTSAIEAEGFRFDMGPTFFLYPEVLRAVFTACGRSLDREVELIKLDPHYRLLFGGGGHLDVAPEPEAMKRALAQLNAEDAKRFDDYLADNRKKLAAFKPILERPFDSAFELLKLPLLEVLPLMRPLASVDRDLRRFFSDQRIRLAFSFQSKYLGMSPFKCPSLFTILSFLEYEYGVYHPRGGCAAVSEAMARVATELGVDIRLNAEVEGIEFEGKRAVGVKTREDYFPCDALTINADFAHAMTKLVPDALRRRWTDRKLEKKRYSCSTYMMYLGLEGECELPHHLIWLSETYEENLKDIDARHVLSADPSFYVHNPCATDETMAPKGQSALYVLVPVTHQHPNVDWNAERERFRARTLRQLERVGVKEVASRIRYEKVITPDDWHSDLHIYRGATFNLAHSLDQMLHLRPRNRFEDLEGVYLTGGGTHPGSGLPVIYESARITSRLMAEDYGLDLSWVEVEGPTPLPRRPLAGGLPEAS